jgi:hypothetical protein
MASNVKIRLRRGLRHELSGDILLPGEMGYTTDTNQLYVGVEEALNELQFDPFANAHAVIQSWLDSSDCPIAGLTVNEDLIIGEIPVPVGSSVDAEVTKILDAMRNYEQTLVFNSATVGLFIPNQVLTQYKKSPTVLTSSSEIPNIASITTTFTLEAVAKSFTAVTLDAIVTDLKADAALITANVITEKVGTNKIKFTKIDGVELNLEFTAGHLALGFTTASNTAAAVSGYGVYAQGTILTSVPGSPTASDTTVTVKISEHSNYYEFEQEGGSPDNSDWRYFGTPSTPDYSALSTPVESTAITGGMDTKIGLFGNQRKNVEVLTEESKNQLFANVHLASHSASTGLRSSLFKKSLATTSGTFLKYSASGSTSFFVDYSLKQVGSTDTFVRVGTMKVINGVPQGITQVKLTDDNAEIWQDDGDGISESDEFSNIEFVAVIDGTDMKINYTQDASFSTEISYTVKRWSM